MSQQELLTRVIEVLDRLNAPYFISGSWASSLQGEPRSTHDLDLVVALEPAMVGDFIAAFPPLQFYLSAAAVTDAIHTGSMFNLLDTREGDKVDFWLVTDDPWDQARFSRRRPEALLGKTFYVSTPEDTILAKLRWARLSGGSEKQFTDALRVYEVQHGSLDTSYITTWAAELGITDLWENVLRQAST